MAWIESHQSLGTHPKTKRAARLLGVNVPAMMGHLHLFWHWALDWAPDGDITDHDLLDIAEAIQWDGDPQDFIDALLNAGPAGSKGFLEYDAEKLVIHDWWDYAGKLIERRRADAERKRQLRAKSDDPSTGSDVPRTSNGRPVDNVETSASSPHLTVTPTVTVTSNTKTPSSSSSQRAKPTPAKVRVYDHDSDEYRLARLFATRVRDNNPKARVPNDEKGLQRWANTIRLMIERDGHTSHEIRQAMEWAQNDTRFWQAVILSPDNLREKFPKVWAQMQRDEKPKPNSQQAKVDEAFAAINRWEHGASEPDDDAIDVPWRNHA